MYIRSLHFLICLFLLLFTWTIHPSDIKLKCALLFPPHKWMSSFENYFFKLIGRSKKTNAYFFSHTHIPFQKRIPNPKHEYPAKQSLNHSLISPISYFFRKNPKLQSSLADSVASYTFHKLCVCLYLYAWMCPSIEKWLLSFCSLPFSPFWYYSSLL